MPFRLQATRDLWRYLGEFDALSEMNELAVRDFLARRHRVERTNGKDCASAFVAAKSKKHRICVNASVVARLSVGMAQTYVCAVWNCADGFLRELRKEHQELNGSQWSDDSSDKPRLKFTLENLFVTEQKGIQAVGPHRHAVLEHCRLVRNRLAHPRSTSDEAVARAYQLVHPHIDQIREEYQLREAPQPMEKMTFEDSVLLSRVTKDVAVILNDKARPNDLQLLQVIEPGAFKHVNNPNRRRNAMISVLCTRFGLQRDEAAVILDKDSRPH